VPLAFICSSSEHAHFFDQPALQTHITSSRTRCTSDDIEDAALGTGFIQAGGLI